MLLRLIGLIALLTSAAHAGSYTLLVPVRTIYPGEEVAAAGLAAKTFKLAGGMLRNWVSEPAQVSGRQARRTLVAGKPIALSALKQPDAVTRGKPARAHFRAGGLEISTLLVPLDDAAAGETVSARNPQSGVIIEALVLESGELMVEAK